MMIKNINEYKKRCLDLIIKKKTEMFNVEIELLNSHFKCESFIEILLYVGLITYLELLELRDVIHINPQFKIGKYRVDFAILNIETEKQIIVECDSQEFHERSEKERRYEKERDRYLQNHGNIVLRFTGKEVMESPSHVSKEILQSIYGKFPDIN